ncbi:MAG: ankyrin repeat domain-containing protein, partial [Alphaproteobacteria bacterium]|nr:ankyrin repeat domain-containing protein [Alphaproteobacteria bacterium]
MVKKNGKIACGLMALAFAALFALRAQAAADNVTELFQRGTPEEVENAIISGTNVNARDNNGMTPLMAAVGHNPNREVIATLIRAGADVNARSNDGQTPLMRAAWENRNMEVLNTL